MLMVALPLAAFAGALVSIGLVFRVATAAGRAMDVRVLLLAGVVYGVLGLKTHAKCCLIVRRGGEQGIQRFVHFGTGNYNERTARSYTDFSLMSADPALANDVIPGHGNFGMAAEHVGGQDFLALISRVNLQRDVGQVTDEIVRSFRKSGFVVADGPEVEDEYHCFDALNTPADHPARHVHPFVTLISIVLFGGLFGFLGILLALPLVLDGCRGALGRTRPFTLQMASFPPVVEE